MSVDHDTGTEELHALRARIDRLEREQHERTAKANAALAAAQDKSYWLDRWRVDLNEVMKKPGASEARAALRAGRAIYRAIYDARYRLRDQVHALPLRRTAITRALAEERERADTRALERFARLIEPEPLRATPVTDMLFGRLTPEDLETIESRLTTAESALWDTSDSQDRRRLALALAAHHRVDSAVERTGLSAATPPSDVHAMGRGAAAAGGSAYYADLVHSALAESGFEISPGLAGLDFGCSSGRVARVLTAAHPGVDWHGCDPNPDAIEWASANLPGIEFRHSPERPPLPYEHGRFDFVFAISIWSHFAEGAALDWLAEMRRILKPGGRLLLTTHGGQTIVHTRRLGVRSLEQLDEIREALYSAGFWYAAEFGEAGDHGVANSDWGTAFLSPEWLLARTSPAWRTLLFRPGRVENNQDLYVLERT